MMTLLIFIGRADVEGGEVCKRGVEMRVQEREEKTRGVNRVRLGVVVCSKYCMHTYLASIDAALCFLPRIYRLCIHL